MNVANVCPTRPNHSRKCNHPTIISNINVVFPFQTIAYRSKHQLTSHLNVHSDDRPFKCDVCSKTFRSRTAFKMHQDEHKGIKRFICKFCDRKFQCHANKLKHERRHIGIKRHKCELCDKGKLRRERLVIGVPR